MNIQKELKYIDKVGATAWGLVIEGEFRKARRTIAKIKNSSCVTESERVIAVIEAKILQRCGKQEEAKKRIFESMGYLWNSFDALEILSASNPECNAETKLYHIEILGGLATLGAFTQFTEQHIVSFDVFANSSEEALSYVQEVVCFAQPESATVLECSSREMSDNESDCLVNRGVVRTYPFRLHEAC